MRKLDGSFRPAIHRTTVNGGGTALAAAFLTAFLSGLILIPNSEAGWDFSVSGFGGYSSPYKTDFHSKGPLTDVTALDISLDNSAVYGGKVTAWTTAMRRGLWGLDIGAEIDVTRFSPNIKEQTAEARGFLLGGVLPPRAVAATDISATIIGINLLARKPFGVSRNFPMGRWYPYLGIGGGVQIAHATGARLDDTDTSPVIQVPAGVKLFITRRIGVFAEYKYTRATHTFMDQSGFSRELTIASNNFIGGIAFHFN
ncbi:outer membrane protein [Candidatus Nitrospira bockiana]